jgi:hypothetical protein
LRDQPFGFAFRHTEGGAVFGGRAGDRDVNEADGPAQAADRLQQPRHEIAMHRAGIAAGAVLQHAEAIDDDIDAVIFDQPRQRRRIHRHHRQLQIERVGLLRSRKSPRDPDHMKSPRAQIVGDEPSDQAGGAEHQDFARRNLFAHRRP